MEKVYFLQLLEHPLVTQVVDQVEHIHLTLQVVELHIMEIQDQVIKLI